jgi:Mce-associated membrane protein
MRWPKLRRADHQGVADSVGETSAEPVTILCAADAESGGGARRFRWTRAVAYGLLPALALLLAPAAGYLKWQDASAHDSQVSGADAVRAATDGTIALLSYKPETVEKDLEAARTRMTGTFLNAYTSLTHDVVIPGAKQKRVAAVATVPAAVSIRASADHAVVLLCVNQAVVVGQDASTTTASSVRVSLDKIGGRWLISQFDPV